jgi:hypothetical protein
MSLPGAFVVDRGGTIRAKLFEGGIPKRPSADALIESAGKLK